VDGDPVRVNIGCGATPTEGWVNLDNSLAVRLARWPLLLRALSSAGLLDARSKKFARIAGHKNIKFANASLRIPFPDSSVEVVYSSHMIEHLDRREAEAFLCEVRRVLRPGGIVRLAAPDLELLVASYGIKGDADDFITRTHMCQERPRKVASRVRLALLGPRHHLWMYDGKSLARLLSNAGFADARVLPAGHTNIVDPRGLDLAERADESVYVEAVQAMAVASSQSERAL
jgi:SAM-dependent methyltransferase